MNGKFLNASFAVELILEDKKIHSVIVRDRNGVVCCVGSLDDAKAFFEDVLEKVGSDDHDEVQS